MNVVQRAADLPAKHRKVCVAIGFFDGVHLGHQQVIRQTVQDAERQEALAVVATFDCHPATVVAPKRAPQLIYSQAQRLRAIAALGADATLLIHFDASFSQQSGESFIRTLHRDLGSLSSLAVGHDFTFGHKRSGNVALLERLGAELGFQTHGLAAVALDGETVSSTRIREAIRQGQLTNASQMLGREYALAGVVARGDQLGRQLGVPTANLDLPGRVLPPFGVYAAHAYVRAERHRAVVNIGLRPTLARPEPELRVEAHLLDFAGDLYEVEVELTIAGRLRGEQKFAGLTELKDQIHRDIAQARALFGDPGPAD